VERGHSTNDGTGLGLPIVQATGEAHGWTVDLHESDVGVDPPSAPDRTGTFMIDAFIV